METIENLKKQYVKHCQEHWVAINNGDSKNANKLHKKIILVAKKIIASGKFDMINDFLESQDENIKLWTACLQLRTYPDKALKALHELTCSSNFFISFDAKETIKLYKSGKWDDIALV